VRKNSSLHLAVVLTVVLSVSLSVHSQEAQPLAVIVNRGNPVTNLSVAELRKILLGDRKYWSGSHRIMVLMPQVGSPEREAILRLLHMDESDYKKHWLSQMFMGDADAAPATLPASGTAVVLVSDAPEAIGFIRLSDVKGVVKIATIDGHSPADSLYPIR